jgi:ABC-2 type transport system permease protein
MLIALEPYFQFMLKAIAREATYRFEVFTSIGSLAVRVYLLRVVWVALYARNAPPHGVELHAIITYSAVALLMGMILDIDQTSLLHDKLHDGSIVVDFMKPISVPLYLFADGTGEVLFHAALIIPSLALALLIVHIDVPSAAVFAAFILSFFLAYFVGFFLNFTLNCIAFWTLEISAVQLMLTWVTDLLGGGIVPLLFFPAGIQQAIMGLPFASMFSTPLLIYIGQIKPEQYAQYMGLQLMWIAVLALTATVIWRAGSRRVVVQGG